MTEEKRFMLRCAVYVLFIKEGKLLMYRRANTGWQDGKYGLPAGHLEENESAIEAAIREAKEESDLNVFEKDLELIQVVHRKFIPEISKETNADYIDLVFLARNWTGEPKLTNENKSDDMIWTDLNNIPENTSRYIKSIIANYKNNVLFSLFSE